MAASSNILPKNTFIEIDELADVDTIEKYINHIPKEDINKPIARIGGQTILFNVIKNKNPGKVRTAAVKKLIEMGADVNKVSVIDGKERSPLELAVESEDKDVTKLLYDNGAIIDDKIISLFNNLKNNLEKNRNSGLNRHSPQEYKHRSNYVDWFTNKEWFKNYAQKRRDSLIKGYSTGPMGSISTKTGGRHKARRATQKVRRNKRKHTRRIHRAYRN
jgi:hypothetical protein